MDKWEQFKEKIKNPNPLQLAKIEYKSHFMQMIGTLIVSSVLIYRGFWWVIFALVFSLGVAYSQGVTAYKKYQAIKQYFPEEKVEDYEKDISPSRRRSKIITYVFGSIPFYIVSFVSSILPYFYLPRIAWYFYGFVYMINIFIILIILYFFMVYWIAYPIYKKKLNIQKDVKGGIENGQTKKD